MIFGFIGKIFKAVFSLVSKIFDWLGAIPKAEDPRGLEIKREGSNQSLPVVYGRRLVGGVVVHKWVTSSVTGLSGIRDENHDNAYLHMIVAFCHGEIDAFEKFLFNGIESTSSQYSNASFIATRTGAVGQTPISQAVTNITNWNNSMVGNGVAYAYMVFYQDKEQSIWRGEPEIQAVIRGRKVFDPRSGLTAWSQNPAICTLDYLNNDTYGRGLTNFSVDTQAFIDAADFCDQTTESTITTIRYIYIDGMRTEPDAITVVQTIQIPRYKLDAVIDTRQEVFDNYRELLQSFRAFPRRPNGKVSLGVEDAGSPMMTFDSAQGQIIGDISFQVAGQRNRYNSFTIVFPNEVDNYERDEVVFPDPDSQLYTDWLAEDNGKELRGELEVNTLANKSSALQSAEIAAKRSRIGGRLSVEVDARARLLEPGDIIGISDVSYGWTNKPWRISRIQETQDNTFKLELNEHSDAVYPWTGSSWDEVEGGTWLGNPANPEAPTSLVLTQDQTLATTGVLTWTAVDDNFVREYQVVIERFDDPDYTQVKDDKTPGTRYTVELLDVGDYRISVYAITTLNYRSSAAVISFTLTVPAAPSSLTTTAGDWGIEVAPQLAGIGLGTVFEFDYVVGDGTGHTPASRGRGSTFTFTGLLPNTLHTVYARSVNAYGESAWISKQVTTTNTGAQVAEFIDPIQQEIDNAQEQIDGLEREGGLFPIQFTIDIAEQFTEVYNDWLRVEDIDTETRTRKQEFFQLSTDLVTERGRIDSTITRVDQVEIDAEGNASAINAINLEVENIDTSLSATIGRVDQVEITADGNATAISTVEGQVNDPVNNTSALYSFVQAAQTTADGNASAITLLEARVEDNEDFASAQLILNAEYEGDLGTLSARAFLGVNVNDQVTGINIEGSVTNGVIEFIGDKVQFLRPTDFSVGFEWSAADDNFIFDGKLIGVDGTFTGELVAATGSFTGAVTGGSFVTDNGTKRVRIDPNASNTFWFGDSSVITEVSTNADVAMGSGGLVVNGGAITGATVMTASGTASRVDLGDDGTYLIWAGSGTKTDLNGTFWIKKNGTGFIKGEFFQGEIIESKLGTASGTSTPVTANANNHDSAGKNVEVTGTFSVALAMDGDTSGTPLTVQIELFRGATSLGTAKQSTVGFFVTGETDYNVSGSLVEIDTITSTGLRDYSATVTYTVNPTGTVNSQSVNVTIKTFENKLES